MTVIYICYNKWLENISLKSAEIQSYIKSHNEIEIEPKTIVCNVNGDIEVLYKLVRNWIGKFNICLDSIQDTSKSGSGPEKHVKCQ